MRCQNAIMDGYNAAKERRVSHKPDRYIQKWLYIRMSAFKRKRIVAPHVTPKLIKILDEGWCPVTRRKLTYGTGLDTDWSLDRVNNDGAYAVSNICVMSTKANLIKGTLSAADIGAITSFMVEEDLNTYNELSFYEWRRLQWLTQKCSDLVGCFMVTPAPPFIQINMLDVIQSFLLLHCFFERDSAASKLKHAVGKKMPVLKKLFKALSNNTEVLKTMGQSECVTLYDLYQLHTVCNRLMDVLLSGN